MREGKRIDLATIWTDIQIDAGIEYTRQLPGCVSFYEEYDAMVEANYNEAEWEQLHYSKKASAVAWYRIRNWMRVHQADAEKMKMDAKGGRK